MSLDLLFPLMRAALLPAVHALSLTALSYASGPTPQYGGELHERVDLIELNHFFDDLGRPAYDQVIFYEWSPDYQRFHVIAWCLVDEELHRMPSKVHGRGGYAVRWYDRDARIDREVKARLYRETWTQVDPERANKKWIDEKYRISLLKLPARKVR